MPPALPPPSRKPSQGFLVGHLWLAHFSCHLSCPDKPLSSEGVRPGAAWRHQGTYVGHDSGILRCRLQPSEESIEFCLWQCLRENPLRNYTWARLNSNQRQVARYLESQLLEPCWLSQWADSASTASWRKPNIKTGSLEQREVDYVERTTIIMSLYNKGHTVLIYKHAASSYGYLLASGAWESEI